jgi:hypothetical protein
VRVQLPVTRATNWRRRGAEALAALALAAGSVAVVSGLLQGRASLLWLGLLLVVSGAVVATAGLSALWVRGRLVEDGVELRGVHRAFADGVVFVRALLQDAA